MPDSHSKSVPILDSILQQLLAAPQLFDFFQAVRLINQAIMHKTAMGENDAQQQINYGSIHFRTTPSFRFPANLIDQVKLLYSENKGLWEFEFQVPFLGLFGGSGLLPNHYTELLIQRLQEKDNTLMEFLDLFNHRIISLFYRAWQKNHFYITHEQAQQHENAQDTFTHMLHSLSGNWIKENKKPQPVFTDEATLFYAGYFADQHRSAWSLQSILSDYFTIPVVVKQFQSKCLFLPRKDRMRLSRGFNSYNQLGITAVLGERIWDCQHHFRLALGPLSYNQFKQFLPSSINLKTLIALTKHYIGNGLTFDICLMLKMQHVPDCRLGANSEIALGRNAWLKTRPLQKYTDDTVITVKQLRPVVN